MTRTSPAPADADEITRLSFVAALAAVELLARFGRDTWIMLRRGSSDDDRQVLRDWPEHLRDMDRRRALAVVTQLAEPPPSATSGLTMTVPLCIDLTDVTGDLYNGPVLTIGSPDGAAARVTLTLPPDDPWARQQAAIVETFTELLHALDADDCTRQLSELDGLGRASRTLVLGRFAGKLVDYGRPQSVIELIEQQADRTPLRRAISHGDRTLRYRQTDALANGLAGALRERGVVAGDVIPVAMTNGLEMPLSYLALMKLGAAFVPIDPAWPAHRIRTAIDVIDPPLVLRTGDITVPHPVETFVVDVDGIVPSDRRPGVEVAPDALAYGVFTSGTTGTPKCAMNRHRGLANRLQFMTRYFAAASEQVVLQNSRHTFDSSIWQLFWPLTTGARTVIPPQGSFLNLEDTVEIILRHGVTVTDFVPGVLNMLVSLVDSDPIALARIGSLRHLVVGGEEISPPAVHRLRALLPGLSITNGYGPSEASIGMVFHPIDATDRDHVPLGRPIDNCFAVVTDDRANLLPPGAVGEILIGGACLGAGYLGDDQRTADVFIANPFPEVPGDRLYRTGDVGYFDAAGHLFFAGRRDSQIKIDGVRIELGEIEAAARAVPGVHDATAVVLTRARHKSLALAVAADDGVTEAALRQQLAGVLPRTNVPRQYVIRAELPLTSHGKVDRRAVEALLSTRSSSVSEIDLVSAADRADQVADVFRMVLDTPDVGYDSDFIERGGDSLRALAVVLALRQRGVHIDIKDLYLHPTARRLAAQILDRERAEPTVAPTDPDHALSAVDSAGPDELHDIFRDAMLPSDLVIRPVADACPPRRLLVTGATGYVGSRVVHEALATTDLRVVVLCRATDDADARERVVETLREQALWRDEYGDRLVGVAGDLALESLGLSGVAWHRLAESIDAVVHAGALVNFLFDYDAHRGANVLGTVEILRLCLTGVVKPLHHVSTLGVLESEARRGDEPLAEGFDPGIATAPTSGYSRSKWVAERLLTEARDKGAGVTIYRVGEAMPAADNGFPNRRALTHLLMHACRALGAYPDTPLRTDYTPVDYIAATLIGGVFDPSVRGRCLHVLHPVTVDFTDVIRGDANLRRLDPVEFLDVLDKAAAVSPALNVVHALVADGPRWRTGEVLTDNARLFDRAEAAALDRRAGLDPVSLPAAIDAYQKYLARHSEGH